MSQIPHNHPEFAAYIHNPQNFYNIKFSPICDRLIINNVENDAPFIKANELIFKFFNDPVALETNGLKKTYETLKNYIRDNPIFIGYILTLAYSDEPSYNILIFEYINLAGNGINLYTREIARRLIKEYIPKQERIEIIKKLYPTDYDNQIEILKKKIIQENKLKNNNNNNNNNN